MGDTHIMTDVALERALDEAEDFPTRRDVGVQIARKALEEARLTGARVSGASLAEEYPRNKVRWWQDRLNTARAELDAGIETELAEQNPDRHADSTIGMPTALTTVEAVPIGMPTPEIGTPIRGAGTGIGTHAAPIGMPISESAHLAVPISTDQVADEPAESWFADTEERWPDSARVSARTPSTAPSGRTESVQAGYEPPAAANQLAINAERPPEPPTTTAGDLGVPQGTQELLEATKSTDLVQAESVPSADPGRYDAGIGMPIGTDLAEAMQSAVPTNEVDAGTGTLPAPIGTPAPAIGMPSNHAETESARDTVPTNSVGMPISTGHTESARAAVPTTTTGTTIGTDRAEQDIPAAPLMAPVETTGADKVAYAFYAVAATAALVGQVWAGVKHIPWPDHGFPILLRILLVAPAVGVIELGGVATAALGDVRRRKGENAYGYRTMSLAAALVALVFNVVGHWAPEERFLAFGFGGLSAFAYILWLIHSGARRRDSLRGTGKLAETAPVYGIVQWVREFKLTKRARDLAVERGYGVHESLRVAREEERTQARNKAIAAAIERRIRELHKDDEIGATIAATTYDLDLLTAEVKKRLNYATAADFIATDLVLEPRRSGQEAGR